jgi:hypothetical protein
LATGDQAIGKIDPTGTDPDTHLAGTGAWFRNLLQPQRGRTGEFMADDGLHGGKISMVVEKKPFPSPGDEKGFAFLLPGIRRRPENARTF